MLHHQRIILIFMYLKVAVREADLFQKIIEKPIQVNINAFIICQILNDLKQISFIMQI